MKKLTALIITAALFVGATYVPIYAEETTTSDYEETSSTADDDEEEATEIPEEPEETLEPITEDYDSSNAVGTDNEEDVSDEQTSYSTSGEAGAAGGLGFYTSKFADCQGHWAEQIIAECTEKGYLSGYEDGTFRPDNPVSAAEFAKIYSAWEGNFYIISSGSWSVPYIRDMISDGIFDAADYNDFNEPMTREQVAKAIVNTLRGEYFPSDLTKYEQYIPDYTDADDGYGEYVIKAYISGIMTGFEDGSFQPKELVTRAEILSIIDRAENESKRILPEAVTAASENDRGTLYYSAAVQVRKSSNASTMNYRLLGSNTQYVTEDDAQSGIKMSEEFQGAQGFAFLMRYDLTEILEREEEIQSLEIVFNRASGGDMDLGLFWYDELISQTDWNNSDYVEVVNGAMVAGSNKAGYNAVVDNISAILPTWGDIENAVPEEEKTQPFAQAALENDQYVMELDLSALKEHADENNIVEFFATTVNYDRYGMSGDNKPKCYVVGEKAPKLYVTYASDDDTQRVITLLADTAKVEGGMLDIAGSGEDSYLTNFRTSQKITFDFNSRSSGKYNMKIYYSANINSGGGTVTFDLNGEQFDHTFAQTGSWSTYVYEDLGEVELKNGSNTLILTDKEVPNTYLINIKYIIFEKVE